MTIDPGFVGIFAAILGLIAACVTAQCVAIAFSLSGDRSRLGSIDGVRGYLATAVLAHHFLVSWDAKLTGVWNSPDNSPFFANLGPSAVILFFMITAFLFYGKIVRRAGSPFRWIDLYLGRIFRIWPMYLVAVLLIVAICFWHQNFRLLEPANKLAASITSWILFIPDGAAPDINGYRNTGEIPALVIWTLRYEWLFYFSLPLFAVCVRLLGGRRYLRVLALLALTCLIMAERKISIARFDAFRFTPFIFGMLAYELTESNIVKSFAVSRVAALVAIAGVVMALFLPTSGYYQVRVLILFAAFFIIASENSIFGIMSLRGSRLLGDASYSIYLLHGIALHIFFNQIPSEFYSSRSSLFWVFLPLVAAIVSVVSIATYRMIEAPFMNIGRAVRIRSADDRAAEIAP